MNFGRRAFLSGAAGATASSLFPHLAISQPQRDIGSAIGLDLWYLTFLVAEEKRFFAKQGLVAKTTSFETGAVALDAIVAGDADIGAAPVSSALVRIEKGGYLRAASSLAASGTLYSVVAREDIKTPADLVGKKLGLIKDGIGEFLYRRFVAANNIAADAVELVNVAPPDAAAALARADVDAVIFWEPWPTKVKEVVPGTHTLARLSDSGIVVNCWLWIGEALANDKPRAAAVLRSLREAADYIKANRQEVIEIGARRLKTDFANAEFQYDNINYDVRLDRKSFTTDYQEMAEFVREKGLIKGILPVETILRREFLESVSPESVTGW